MKDSIIYSFRKKCLLPLCLVALAGCEAEKQYDFPGDAVSRIFINTQTNNDNRYTFNVVHTPAGAMGDEVVVKLPARATQPVQSDTRVSFAIDHGLVAAYNDAHQTDFAPVPEGLLTIVNESLTIAKGQTISTDSLVISIPNRDALTEASYLVGLRLGSLSAGGATEISENMDKAYIRIQTKETNVYDAPASVPGEMIVERSGWTATVVPEPSMGAAGNMFTNSNQQHWTLAPAAECAITVDLGEMYADIQGIRLGSSNNYRLALAETSVSANGTEWVSQGVAPLANANNQHIQFYAPVTARYIRVNVLGWQNSSNIRVTQFYIYQ